VRVPHDLIAQGVYGAIEGAHGTIPKMLAAGVALCSDDQIRISESSAGTLALGALNGLYGDALAGGGNPLAFPMTFRHEGQDLDLRPGALAAAIEDATPRLAVFVHGLCETDRSWFSPAGQPGRPPVSHGVRLRRDLGYTALYVRYNTGLHISQNGLDLTGLLDEVIDGWPQPVEEIILVGHSMGGLVARSACQQGAVAGCSWIDRVRHVFCLATPHTGSHVEQGANVAGWALNLLPETRPFARALNSRSAGIKDLRFGSCLESDWLGHDPDEFLKDRCEEVPFLGTAHYYFIGVTITHDAGHPAGRVFGDLLVRYPSASGKSPRRVVPFEMDKGRHVGGLHHFHLLHNGAVYDQLRRWLEQATVGEGEEVPTPTGAST
jgi:pimeloyl-ACP methyl ester carboxylesterase